LSIPYNFYNGALKRNEDPSQKRLHPMQAWNVLLAIWKHNLNNLIW
jgi:hypothetical protein